MGALAVSALLVVMWILPYVKVWRDLALWHVVLAVALVICIRGVHDVVLTRRNHAVLLGMLVLPVYMVIRDAVAGNVESVAQAYYLRNLGGFLSSIVIGAVLQDTRNRKIVMTVLVIIGLLNGILGILQFLDPVRFYQVPDMVANYFGMSTEEIYHPGRIRGFFVFIDKYGLALGMLAMLLMPLGFSKKGRHDEYMPSRIVLSIAFMTMIAGLMLTYLRAFYFGFAVTFLLYLLLGKTGLLRSIGIAVIVVVGTLFFDAVVGVTGSREWERIYRLHDTSNMYRMYTINAALQAIRENPIFGVGGRRVELYLKGTKFEIHNAYIKITAFYGITGLLGYLVFVLSLFRQWRCIPQENAYIAHGLILCFIYYMMFCLAHPTVFWLDGFFEWTFVGILIGYANQSDSLREQYEMMLHRNPSHA